VPNNADYTVKLCSDDEKYGGQNLVEYMTYPAKEFDGKFYVELYLPARTAVVLKEGRIRKTKLADKKVKNIYWFKKILHLGASGDSQGELCSIPHLPHHHQAKHFHSEESKRHDG
jgi:hypothetical protein